MIVDAYTFCWNEEVRLPYFLRLWSPICRRIIIYDNGSTDRSKEIALKYPNVVWDSVTYGLNEINELKLTYIKNNCWKQNRDADLCFVGDIDEFSYHSIGLEYFLSETYNQGFTVFQSSGYEMVSEEPPSHGGMIWDHADFQYGIKGGKDYHLDKTTIFSPKNIEEMNYVHGAQNPKPVGNVKVLSHLDLKLLHYKLIGKKYYIDKLKGASNRLSRINMKNGWGKHYRESSSNQEEYFDKVYSSKTKVI